MKEIIRTLLYEWLGRELPEVKDRELKLDKYLPVNQVVVVKGFRRVGKTYLLYNLIKNLLKERPRKDVIYINFEDERIPSKTEFLTYLLPAIKEVTRNNPSYLFLDEIQAIPDWSRWVRRVFDTEKIKIFITGSSSKVSEKEIPTELRGRYLEIELHPLSFREFLMFKNIPLIADYLTENAKALYLSAFNEYLQFGGMPEVVLSEEGIKKEILLNYYNTLIRRDVIEKNRVRNEECLKDLVRLLLNSTHYTATKFFNTLKSIGHNVGKATIIKYISHLRDSFFINEVFEFSPKAKSQLQRERKIYIVDNGFLNLLTTKLSFIEGRLLENSVFWHLKSRFKNRTSYYFRADKGEEVDFITVNDGQKMIQVSYNISGFSTREREIRALVKAGKRLRLKEAEILTFDTERDETVSWFGHTLKLSIKPAWKSFIEEQEKISHHDKIKIS